MGTSCLNLAALIDLVVAPVTGLADEPRRLEEVRYAVATEAALGRPAAGSAVWLNLIHVTDTRLTRYSHGAG